MQYWIFVHNSKSIYKIQFPLWKTSRSTSCCIWSSSIFILMTSYWQMYRDWIFFYNMSFQIDQVLTKHATTVPATLTFTFLSYLIVRVSYPILRLSYPIVRVSYQVFRLPYRENRLSGYAFIVYQVLRVSGFPFIVYRVNRNTSAFSWTNKGKNPGISFILLLLSGYMY